MAVYVDDAAHPFGRLKLCHCWADTEEELLAMMSAIGVRHRWYQRKGVNASWDHFDICLTKKAKALALGAILTDRYGPAEHVARLDLAEAKRRGDKEAMVRHTARIAGIAGVRARRDQKLRSGDPKKLLARSTYVS